MWIRYSPDKRGTLKLFLDEHKPDILMIAEHKLNARNNLRIDGYVTHIQNRIGCRGGGTAILINNNIHCVWFHLETHNVESTAVEIYRPNGTSISVVALYAPFDYTFWLWLSDTWCDNRRRISYSWRGLKCETSWLGRNNRQWKWSLPARIPVG